MRRTFTTILCLVALVCVASCSGEPTETPLATSSSAAPDAYRRAAQDACQAYSSEAIWTTGTMTDGDGELVGASVRIADAAGDTVAVVLERAAATGDDPRFTRLRDTVQGLTQYRDFDRSDIEPFHQTMMAVCADAWV